MTFAVNSGPTPDASEPPQTSWQQADRVPAGPQEGETEIFDDSDSCAVNHNLDDDLKHNATQNHRENNPKSHA